MYVKLTELLGYFKNNLFGEKRKTPYLEQVICFELSLEQERSAFWQKNEFHFINLWNSLLFTLAEPWTQTETLLHLRALSDLHGHWTTFNYYFLAELEAHQHQVVKLHYAFQE